MLRYAFSKQAANASHLGELTMKRSIVFASLLTMTLPALAFAQSAADLRNAAKTPDRILTYGMSYSQQRFSTLKQIDRQTVKRLVPAWSYSLDSSNGEESQALVMGGVMYITSHDKTVALDAETGKEIWNTMMGDPKDGLAMTGAPLVANGVVITGVAGSEFSARGYIEGYEAETGNRLWRRYTVPRPGEAGAETWPDNAAKASGGSTWTTGSYDPGLDLVYWGVGNPSPWNALDRKGDNLFTDTILAVRPKTGEMVWYYQTSPNDPFDYDNVQALVLADRTIGGQPRKVVMQAARNGFFYVLDRSNGKLLA